MKKLIDIDIDEDARLDNQFTRLVYSEIEEDEDTEDIFELMQKKLDKNFKP